MDDIFHSSGIQITTVDKWSLTVRFQRNLSGLGNTSGGTYKIPKPKHACRWAYEVDNLPFAINLETNTVQGRDNILVQMHYSTRFMNAIILRPYAISWANYEALPRPLVTGSRVSLRHPWLPGIRINGAAILTLPVKEVPRSPRSSLLSFRT